MNSANPARVSGWRQRFQVALQLRSLASPRVQKVLLIASALNHEHLYGYRDRVRQLGYRRLDPALVDDDTYADRWKSMSELQKVCWTWRAINQEIVRSVEQDPRARLYRFEDFFIADDRIQHMEDMLRFITDFGERRYPWHISPDLFDRRINGADRARFPDWQDWSREEARDLDQICGPLMRQLNYGTEPEWREKLTGRDRARPKSAERSVPN